jgi:hypothetical protein
MYFIQAAGLGTWFYCLIVYPLRYYSSPTINNWRVLIYGFPSHAGPIPWVIFPFVYATVPLVYFVFVAATRQRWKKDGGERWDQLLLLAITGFAIFLAVSSAPSIKRLATVSPPAMILLTWLLIQPGKVVAGLRILLGSTAVALAIAMPVHVQTRKLAYLHLPAGRAAFFDPDLYAEYRWFLENTRPDEYSFCLAPLYYAFHLRNPAAIEAFQPSDYTRPWQVTALVEALESRQVRMLVLRRTQDFLWAESSPSDHLEPLRAYVSRNYQLSKTFPTGDEVWLRVRAPAVISRR